MPCHAENSHPMYVSSGILAWVTHAVICIVIMGYYWGERVVVVWVYTVDGNPASSGLEWSWSGAWQMRGRERGGSRFGAQGMASRKTWWERGGSVDVGCGCFWWMDVDFGY